MIRADTFNGIEMCLEKITKEIELHNEINFMRLLVEMDIARIPIRPNDDAFHHNIKCLRNLYLDR